MLRKESGKIVWATYTLCGESDDGFPSPEFPDGGHPFRCFTPEFSGMTSPRGIPLLFQMRNAQYLRVQMMQNTFTHLGKEGVGGGFPSYSFFRGRIGGLGALGIRPPIICVSDRR